MSKNLKVNSKSTIAEFKRKHNWLVENSTIKLNVSNIKSLTNEDIESLRCGDIVLKEDDSGKHAYLVTFRNNTGICLTYVDASVIETQSYDKVNNVWTYNSEDKTPLPIDGEFDGDISIDGDLYVDAKISAGSVQTAEINGETNPSVKPIYCHPIYFRCSNQDNNELRFCCLIFNNDPTPFTSTTFKTYIEGLMNNGAIILANGYIYVNNVNRTCICLRKFQEYYSVYSFTETDGVIATNYIGYFTNIIEFVDGVNKIN